MTLRLRSSLVAAAALATALLLAAAAGSPAVGQTDAPEATARAEADRAAAEALRTMQSLIDLIDARSADAAELRAAIDAAETDVDRAAASEALQAFNTETERLRRQIEAIATGVAVDALDPAADQTFNLQRELEDLIQPFVLMLKSATENAREIERLRRAARLAAQLEETAVDALESLDALLRAGPSEGPLAEALLASYDRWRERRDQARDELSAAQRQLETRLAARNDPTESAGAAFTAFFSERGRNLALGLGAFAAVMFALRLVRRSALWIIGAPRNRAAPVRIGAFIFDVLTVIGAATATLAVFNAANDWLLTGLSVIVLLGLGWFLLRSAPSLAEQVTLLLNLGAVQEGERLMLEGVPWRVAKLDFYTDLQNPALTGGEFTLPIRELRGMHSRPSGPGEAWFPSETGDVVALASGLWGEVVFQSPELVQVKDEGGSITTMTVAGYLDQSPRNLSRGYRVETVIGVDYAHQADAPDAIPRALERFLEPALREKFGAEALLRLECDLIGAGDSALEIEAAAWMAGASAHRVEDVRDALTRLSVQCCTENGWEIPFQTLTLKQG